MAAFKGVELFGEFADDASTSKFPQWQIMVRMALNRRLPEHAKFISRSAQELKTEIDEEVAQAANAYDAGRIRRDHDEADEDAAGHLLLFLAEPIRSQVHRFRQGSAVWAYLHKQHEMAAQPWSGSRGCKAQFGAPGARKRGSVLPSSHPTAG
jgi:hypothetical protein